MVPWQLYNQYGNTQIIEENIEPMMNWLNGMDFYDFSETYPHLSAKTTGLADWLAMDERTPADLVNNAIYIYMMELTAQMADAIGYTDYATILRKRHALAKAEWNKAYVNPKTGKTQAIDGTLVHSQSSYATPLNFNCFDETNKAKAEAYLVELAANPSTSGRGKKNFRLIQLQPDSPVLPIFFQLLAEPDIWKKLFACSRVQTSLLGFIP